MLINVNLSSLESFVGKTFILTNNHPWSEEIGIGVQLEETPVGIGLRVQLKNKGNVYVFDPNQCELIKEEINNG